MATVKRVQVLLTSTPILIIWQWQKATATHSILVFYFEQGYHSHRSLFKKQRIYIHTTLRRTNGSHSAWRWYVLAICVSFLVEQAMYTIKADTEHINPGQVPVIAKDQPLYIIAKVIQWSTKGQHLFTPCPLSLMEERLPSLCGAVCQQRCWETGRSPGGSWTGTWQRSHLRCLGPQCTAGKCGVRWDWVQEVAAYYIKRCPLFSTLCHSSLYDRNGNEFILFANHNGTLNRFFYFLF